MADKRTLTEWMRDVQPVDRWFVTKVFIAGAFAGALLAITYSLLGFAI